MHTFVYRDVDLAIAALADYFVVIANEAVKNHGRCTIALSGGSSPVKLHQLLSAPPYRQKVNWDKLFFFIGDERNVPATHAESNFGMAKATLFDPLQLTDNNYFAVNTSLSPGEAAKDYNSVVYNFFKGEPVFDLVLLGLGDDAHTASLFPFTSVIHEQQPVVKEVFVEKKDTFRITFTAPLINKARHVAFMAFGPSKAPAVKQVLKGERNTDKFPAQLIKPIKGEVAWYLDAEAAGMLE